MSTSFFDRLIHRDRSRLGSQRKGRRTLRRQIQVESLEDRRLLVADLVSFVTQEHVDINVLHNGSAWTIGPLDSDSSTQYENDEVVMYVGSPATTARPTGSQFDFIGVGAGQDFYLLPQFQDPDVIYPGVAGYGVSASSLDSYNAATESKGRITGNLKWIKASLADVRHTLPDGTEGSGHFSAWQTGSFGGATVFMSSFNDGVSNPNGSGLDVTDGISSDDVIWLLPGGHAHYNLGFTQPGRYEVDLRASAYFGDDGLATPNLAGFSQSESFTLYFSVMNVGQLQIEESSYAVDESAGTISIDVIRVGGSDGRIAVDYETADGSAVAPGDYTASSGTLEFLDGETRKTIVIPIIDDSEQEGNETFTLTLLDPTPLNLNSYIVDVEGDSNGLLGSTSEVVVTILSNDSSNTPPTISDVSDLSTLEGVATPAVEFMVGDAESAATALTISGSSSNIDLVPNGNIVIGGSGENRTVTVTPVAGQIGTATITLTVTDPGGLTAVDTFVLTVTQGAVDDAFAIVGQEVLTGSVLLNDDWDNAVGVHTTTVETTTSHGSLVLQPNGSFTYEPAATFTGSDSFTYRLNDPHGGFNTATVTITQSAAPEFVALLSEGHADIGVNFAEGAWDLHIHDEETDTEYEPAEALLLVGPAAVVTRDGDAADAAYDFLGVPVGSQLFVLPEIENTSLLFLGIGGEELATGLLAGDLATLQLASVAGPGEFSIWQAGLTPTTPNLIMATSDGIDASDTFDVAAGSHAHVNYGFSQPGFYEVSFIGFGIDSAGNPTDSGSVTYYFYVTDQQGAVDDTFTMAGQVTLQGSVTLNDDWDDAVGTPMTTVETGTSHGSLVLQPNGSFTYEPDATFAGSDSFTYRLNDPRGGFTTATVTITQSVASEFVALLSEGHADIGVNFADGAWDLHIHDEETDTEYEPAEALLLVGPAAVVTRDGDAADAAYDFLGVPVGSQLFVLPEIENTSLLFLGIGGEELATGLLAGDLATLQLASVAGPGEFSIWQAGLTPTTPNLIMATSNGIDASDTFDVAAGSHAHVNYGFSQPGFYEVSFIGFGIDAEGNPTNSGPVTYYFYVTDQQGAVDDAFTMAGQATLQGSVTLNDEWDVSLGEHTVSVDSPVSHGTLQLQPNGSFTYEPDATFAGSDSFTYRLMNPNGGFTTATVTINQAAAPAFIAVLSEGHADIGINYAEDAWDLHIHDEENEAEYAPSEALLVVGPEALTTRSGDAALPAYDFLGVGAGEALFVLPEIENPALLFLGIGAEELASGVFAPDEVQLQLYSVSGPGDFAIWQAGLTPESPMLHMATADGVDAGDSMTVLAGGHNHVNFAFTKPGVYEVTFVASGVTADGTQLTSEPTTYFFRVGSVAPVLSAAYATSTTWAPSFIDSIDGAGAGAGNGIGLQLTSGMASIPWQGMNRLQLQFSESVMGVSASTIELRDSNGPLPITVQYDPSTFVATIEINQSISFSKLRLAVSDQVTDALGIALDGDQNDVAGGVFDLRFDVLVGDTNGDGRVLTSDLVGFGTWFNSQPGQAAFNPRANWNGDDRINTSDLLLFSPNFSLSINDLNEPGAPFGGAGQGSGGYGVSHDFFFGSLGKEDEDDDDDDDSLIKLR